MEMNRLNILLFLLCSLPAVFAAADLEGQPDPDARITYYNRVEPVMLELSKVPYGTIHWQESHDGGKNWDNIPGAAEFRCSYSTDTSAQVRAVVLAGTCDTLKSQVVILNTMMVLTGSVDSITDTSAVIHCAMDTGTVTLTEYGLLYSDREGVDEDAMKISHTPPVMENFQARPGGLTAGVRYYARAYAITGDGEIIYGNILDFTPIRVSILQNLNITGDTAILKYEVTGPEEGEIDEHGILINTLPGSRSTSTRIPGSAKKGVLTAVAGDLSPGTDYFVQAYIRQGDSHYYSPEKKITTWSDYTEPVDSTPFTIAHRIEWNDPSTARKISQDGTFGEYGRIERVGESDTLLLVYHGGPGNGDWINIYMRRSFDNGETWEDQEILMDLADHRDSYWRFCTPEILYLQNGWILVAYEANARPDENQSSVQILISRDSALTWQDPVIIRTGRTWEPSMVQLPHGELELFYSSEAKWWPDGPLYQDIQVIRSTDNGESWSDPQVVAYYPEKRDGMPVPVVLQGNKGVALAIETVNVGDSPYIVQRDMDAPWILTTSNFEASPHRWLVNDFSGHGGAPYLIQLPTGETILSAHIYRGGDWHQNNYQQVLIGDNDARNFEGLTSPWGVLPWDESAVNNSLFLKNDTTIVTISTRMFPDGSGGLYWLEGKIVPKE